ncbi:hypothetical protein HDU98_001865 [Podochytrium sp. JEL0797]|nr:hypothetical protein HDU98_001865 [Podochytrium sp. JEL0797]
MAFVSFQDFVSPACAYALQNDIMISNSCGQADVGHPFNASRANECVCKTMNPMSVWVYCAGDDQKYWIDMYNSDVNGLTKSCAAANLTIPPHPLLPLPSGTYAPTVSLPVPTEAATTATQYMSIATTTSRAAPVSTTTKDTNIYSGAVELGASVLAAFAAPTLSTPLPSPSFLDPSQCFTGPGLPTPSTVLLLGSNSPTIWTASTCNTNCTASASTGITHSALTQTGGEVLCMCLIRFDASQRVEGCASCVGYMHGVTSQNFANCGVQDEVTGFVGLVAAVAVVSGERVAIAELSGSVGVRVGVWIVGVLMWLII